MSSYTASVFWIQAPNFPMALPEGTTYEEALQALAGHSELAAGTFTLYTHNDPEGAPLAHARGGKVEEVTK